MKFADLGLSPEVLKAVEETGYESPTPIQEKAIPYVLMGRDVLGTAQTGTGKTASFTLPMIDILASGQAKARMPRSLILEPTRELAAQVADNFETYGKYSKLSMALLIGGMSFADQDAKLDKGVDVLIATPGRLLDHVERGKVLLNGVKTLVIDEADRMMDMGFIPDVERIVSLLPPLRQTLFFSATMSKDMRKLADKFLLNPKEVAVSLPTSTAATVTQGLVIVKRAEKRPALRKLLEKEEVKTAFIFCNRKKDVDILLGSLMKHGFNAGALHGDMSQSHRMETLDKFKAGEIKLLVCSDVAARGIDVSSVSHVFNFDVPTHAEDYIHRIGRTGRAGQEGHAYTIVTKSETKYLDGIQKLVGRDIPILSIDGMDQIAEEGAVIAEREKGSGRDAKKGRRRANDDAPPAKSSRKSAPRDDDKAPSKKSEARNADATEEKTKDKKPPRRSRQANDDQDPPVVGLGDNIPAFFKIPLRKTAQK
ncbi:DEAD/DEAH box helicase [Sneathiella sp. HT1-7]|uniref:DEAD/DEAH box helicase n=1 Tax=Sneathiella sp. HT1-7 TaxID=2887192 RepID=UPI001D13F658|nr:DEAD/DEAH box helicase [Sneathiella sp. HT1-7]MCC3306159.1 DEAD/DEAH box helicase [Sneathiella sp. HT1-7]